MKILRTCIVSKKLHNPRDMIRINASKDGQVTIDYQQKLKGRGAYLSFQSQYVLVAQKRKLLDQKLKTSVPQEIYQILFHFMTSKN
ncbi:YlxR family protein [Candidatus Phytoplasma meliae]|uniref:YlxR family protein n=1 Tax=Candidatus Phytoplasma meliae TaxID=1848402 RepID=A0ABS5CY47_9MOLU|nr:YlxR family protein [Candidatus Phytoplasma meliae]MBP5835909.1 YlxR family protein [Candidatus Phytoplasma meliae]